MPNPKQRNAQAVDSPKLAEVIVQGLQEKKGLEITVLDLRQIKNAVADYFVICSGTSDTHVDALRDGVEDEVAKHLAQFPWRKEGLAGKEWILLDYIDVVVHIFQKQRRQFYALEELWGDALITNYE